MVRHLCIGLFAALYVAVSLAAAADLSVVPIYQRSALPAELVIASGPAIQYLPVCAGDADTEGCFGHARIDRPAVLRGTADWMFDGGTSAASSTRAIAER